MVPFVLVLETATRVEQAVRFGAPLLGAYTYDSALYGWDQLGIRGRPFGVYEKWALNSHGLRGPEIQSHRSPELLRIATVGASETFGLFETAGHEWPRQLEQRLRDRGRQVEVINASLAGLGLRQRLRFLEARIQRLQPDLIVLMLEYPSYVGVVRNGARNSIDFVPPGLPERTFIDFSPRIIRRAKDVLLPRLPVAPQRILRSAVTRLRLARLQSDLGQDFGSRRHVSEAERTAFADDVTEFLGDAEVRGQRVILVAPALLMTGESLLDFIANYPYLSTSWIEEARVVFPDLTRGLVAGHRTTFVNLDDALGADKQSLMQDLFHFNDSGASRVSEVLATAIEEVMSVTDATTAALGANTGSQMGWPAIPDASRGLRWGHGATVTRTVHEGVAGAAEARSCGDRPMQHVDSSACCSFAYDMPAESQVGV
jgi:hypothetical protein